MNAGIQIISVPGLALAFIPALVVVVILVRWSLDYGNALVGMVRMLGQLLAIGYLLNLIFAVDAVSIVLIVLSVMVVSAGWIALRNVPGPRPFLYRTALLAILCGGGMTFIFITGIVLDPDPWYAPRYTIPLAGMIFAGAMNTISLSGERYMAESRRGASHEAARNTAFHAALIPHTNSLFAVGLVSLPGMMTGQILSGTSPLIAVRYQIMVMCMLYGSAGIAAAVFLTLLGRSRGRLLPSPD